MARAALTHLSASFQFKLVTDIKYAIKIVILRETPAKLQKREKEKVSNTTRGRKNVKNN